jgi:glycosyltransferase involved in cell wall biosynthesis
VESGITGSHLHSSEDSKKNVENLREMADIADGAKLNNSGLEKNDTVGANVSETEVNNVSESEPLNGFKDASMDNLESIDPWMRRKIEDASSKVNGSAPIYLLHGDLSEEDMWKLYNHPKVKASISFTHGEGYGRPLLEFSMTGKPVIVSNWSGHLDFLDEKGAVLLEGQLRNVDESAANQFLLKDTQWFYVNYSNAAVKMLDIYNNYDKYSVESKKLAERNRTKFSINSMTESLRKIANTHIKVAQKIDLILPD